MTSMVSPIRDIPAPIRQLWRCTVLLLVALACAGTLSAQEPATEARSGLLTRAELEAQAARAASGSEEQRAEAASLRERLREGDFKVGDRIALRTEANVELPVPLLQALNDTLVVREGKVIRLPNMPDLSLQGVLRSELVEKLGAHLNAYLRDVAVRAEPMIQGLISGPVSRPGYVTLAPDMLVTDAIMAGGGASQNADVTRSIVRRDGRELIDRDSLRIAVRNGATLDRIGFQSGDEIAVGEKKQRNWSQILQIISISTTLLLLGLRLANN